MQQPLVGSPPVGSAPVAGAQPPAASETAAVPVTAASTPTAFIPAAGQQSGAPVDGGGLTQDVTLGHAATIATGVAANGAQSMSSAVAAQQAVASQQVVDPTLVQGAAQGSAAPSGPAAWNDSWSKQFRDAGAPQQIIQQLQFTGAMGADEAKLQQMLDEIKGQVDSELATFAHKHPEEFKKLRSKPGLATAMGMPGESDRAALAQLAAASNAGQLPDSQLKGLADQAGTSMSSEFKKMGLSFALYGLIPGWGFLRLSGFAFNDGKEPFTDYPMWDNGMNKTFTVMGAMGGALTIYNNVRGAMNVAAGHAAIRGGGDAASIAAREGLDQLSTFDKIRSYVPGTRLNQQVGALSSLEEIKSGIAAMNPTTDAGRLFKEAAQANYDKVVSGDALLWRDAASKWTKMGYQPNSRGFVVGNIMGPKGAISLNTQGSRPMILLDGRTRGPVTTAHFGSLAELVDDTNGLRSRIFQHFGKDMANAAHVKEVNKLLLGHGTQELLSAGQLARPTGASALLAKFRPSAVMDAVHAADNLSGGAAAITKGYGWQSLPKFGRWGIIGTAVAGGVYMMGVKPQLDMRKQAAEEAAKQQQAAQAEGQGVAAPAPGPAPSAPAPATSAPATAGSGFTSQGLGLG